MDFGTRSLEQAFKCKEDADEKAHENILVFYKKLPTYNPQMTNGEPYDKGTKLTPLVVTMENKFQ